MPSDSEDRNIEQPEESAVSEPVLTDDGKSLRHWLLVPAGVVGIAFVVGIVLYFLLTGGGIDEAPDALEAPTSTVAEPAAPPSGETGALPEAAPIVLPPLSTSDDFVGDVLRSLSKKKMYGSPNSNPSPELGADKENHTSWERYYQVSDCSSSLRNDWYSGI